MALKKLGEPLSAKENSFLQQHSNASLVEFEAIDASQDDDVNLSNINKA